MNFSKMEQRDGGQSIMAVVSSSLRGTVDRSWLFFPPSTALWEGRPCQTCLLFPYISASGRDCAVDRGSSFLPLLPYENTGAVHFS